MQPVELAPDLLGRAGEDMRLADLGAVGGGAGLVGIFGRLLLAAEIEVLAVVEGQTDNAVVLRQARASSVVSAAKAATASSKGAVPPALA